MSQQTLMMKFKRRSLVRSSQAMLMLSTCKLQRHGLNGPTADTDRQIFKKVMPVISTYEDIQPDISCIANGGTSPIFCSNPIFEFLTSSSRTSGGERKLIMPAIVDEQERRSLLYSLLMPIMSQFVPGQEKAKGRYFLFIKSEANTPGDLVARPVLTSYYKSSHFKNRPYDPYNCFFFASATYSTLFLASIFFLSKTVESLTQRQWYFGAQRIGMYFVSSSSLLESPYGIRLIILAPLEN